MKRPDIHIGSIVSAQEYFERLDLPLYIFRTRATNSSRHPVHCHEFTELVIVISGSCIHLTENERSPLKTGDFFIINKGMKHGYEEQKNFKLINILLNEKRLPIPQLDFESSALAKHISGGINSPKVIFTLDSASLSFVKHLAVSIEHEYKERKKCFRFRVMAFFMLILTEMERNFSRYSQATDAQNFHSVDRTLEFIKIHFADKISLVSLAKKMNMSKRNFFRVFKKSTGLSPLQYLNNIRVKHAKELLLTSDLSFDEIAYRCGLSNRQCLNYNIRKIYGVTLSNIRDSHADGDI